MALLLANSPEFIVTWIAIAKVGAIEVPINFAHKGKILQYLIDYSDSTVIVTDAKYMGSLQEIEDKLPKVKRVIYLGDSKDKDFRNIKTINLTSLSNQKNNETVDIVKYNDLCAILYTSGTTGVSKGVMMTHNHMLFIAHHYAHILNVSNDDVFFIYTPLFHFTTQCFFLAMLISNGTCVLKSNFSASRFWDDIKHYRCTISVLFEAVSKILIKAPTRKDDNKNTLKYFITAHITPEVHKEFDERFKVKLINCYGMSEVEAPISSTYELSKPGSCGKANNDFEIRLFNENDEDVPDGGTGEIVIRPLKPHIMFEGYYKMPEKTLAACRNLWFHTSDLAYRDKDGFYYFVGREKDMIRRGGENISAIELETIVENHPDVKECAAVAIESEIWGEEIKLVVVPKEGKTIDPKALIKYCDKNMAYFMVPRFIEIVEDLPNTGASGRPIKSKLKEITESTWDRHEASVKIERELNKQKDK